MLHGRTWLEQNATILIEFFIHLFAWCLYLLFVYLFNARPGNLGVDKLAYFLGVLVTDLPLFYVVYSIAIPKLLVKDEKVWQFIILSFLILLLYLIGRFSIHSFIFHFFSSGENQLYNTTYTKFIDIFLVRLLGGVFIFSMACIGRFTFDWFKNNRIKRALETRNLNSELAFLKSQISPHFLFNTLNNIHTLAYKKSDLAPDAIMKLSELMRYMIYESDEKLVPLEKEVHYLKSFIDLQHLRHKVRNIAILHLEGVLSGHNIAPLILIPFVENAFKHGSNLDAEGAIAITLKTDGHIYFSVSNSLRNSGDKVNQELQGGVGLENLRRRLDLIYSGKYTLDIVRSSSQHIIKLLVRS